MIVLTELIRSSKLEIEVSCLLLVDSTSSLIKLETMSANDRG